MSKVLFIGFKGKNNTSGRMAESISPDHLLLTNSFTGLKKDIDSITEEYDLAVMFGVDKVLSSTVRLEKSAAMDGKKLYSKLELSKFAESLEIAGIDPVISDDPGKSLCNEACLSRHIPIRIGVNGGSLEKKLYSMYLSYLPANKGNELLSA